MLAQMVGMKVTVATMGKTQIAAVLVPLAVVVGTPKTD